MRRLSAALCCLVLAAAAHAEWTVTSSESEASSVSALNHKHVVLANTGTGASVVVDLAVFAGDTVTLRLIDNPDGANSLADAMRNGTCIAGVNGGYFDEQFAPLGLRVVDGKTLSPLRRAALLTGVLVQSARGVQILRRGELSRSETRRAAVQCGPLLVDLARPVRGLEGTREARRTFAATTAKGRAAIGCSSEVSLAELGAILAGDVGGERFQRALNLDGGSSTAFWFRRKTGAPVSIAEQKPVRDFVGLAPK